MTTYDENLRTLSAVADASIGIYTGPPGLPGSAAPNTGMMYRAVKITGTRTVGLATGAANEVVAGVLQNKPQQVGAAATVAFGGISNMISGGTIAAGDRVGADAQGRAVTVATGGFGVAWGPITAVGQLLPVKVD